MYETMNRTYWFPEMKEKIKKHVEMCHRCIAFAPKLEKVEGFVKMIPKGNIPFEIVHVDHKDIFDSRVSGKKHILVVKDGFTKFTKLYPTKTTKSAEAIACLKQYFVAYSKPRVLISDRGTCFTSEDFNNFVLDYDVKHVKVATASPQANGQVERTNCFLAPMLAKLSEHDSGKTWPKVVNEVEYAINNCIHKTTGETPSKMLFGVDQRGKFSDEIKEFVENEINKTSRNLEELRSKASTEIKKDQNYNENYVNKKRKEAHKYELGDYVMIRNFDNTKGISPKLRPKFKGPYVITRILRNDRYVVADIQGFQLTQKKYEGVWEPANMRPWTPGNNT